MPKLLQVNIYIMHDSFQCTTRRRRLYASAVKPCLSLGASMRFDKQQQCSTGAAFLVFRGNIQNLSVWWQNLFVCVPAPAWHLLKTITKALHSKALLGGPWQQPRVPDYTNVCQPTLSTCRQLLSKQCWGMGVGNRTLIWGLMRHVWSRTYSLRYLWVIYFWLSAIRSASKAKASLPQQATSNPTDLSPHKSILETISNQMACAVWSVNTSIEQLSMIIWKRKVCADWIGQNKWLRC